MKCKNCKNLINGWCEKKIDSPVPEIERKCDDYEVKTNYDYIKQMSIDEMVDYFSDMFDCNLCSESEKFSDNPLLFDEKCDNDCIKHCKEWLESEVEK